MRLSVWLAACLVVGGGGWIVTQASPLFPTLGVNLNSIDVYECSVGPIVQKGRYGIAVTAIANHNKLGIAIPMFYQFDDRPLHNTTIVFWRPRYAYYYNRDFPLNLHHYEHSVIGIDVGIGGSGSSPLIVLFTGIRYGLRQSKLSYSFGIGINL